MIPPSFFSLSFFSFRPDIGIEEFEERKVNFDERVDADEKLVPDNLSWGSTAPVLPDNQGKYKVPVPGKSV